MPDYPPDLLEFPLFRQIYESTPERLGPIYDCLEYVQHPVGHKLLRYGELGDALYFAATGKVVFSIDDNLGNPRVLETAEAGRIFGEVAFFNSSARRSADAVVVEDFTGFRLTQERRSDFFTACPEAAERIMSEMAQRLTFSSKQMKGMFSSLEEAVQSSRTPSQNILDRVAEFCGSNLWFLPINISILVLLYHQGQNNHFTLDKDDISLIIGFGGTVGSVIVLNSQNRDARDNKARDRAIDQRTQYLKSAIEDLRAEIKELK